ncbi:MAG: protein-(glutamine-N5) methyltransferase, release factor-specific [Deltaproteobacteria bacterium CG11_big_fil_rev_8_21_14_0_20_45_16]|nr:MAG: protein-(glutamine-N5) methyltransferase, release factor-specific [Deltaproteobacteria bacterium CG11_big_fil_rev_8_21_14_0_20_45_16]
MKLKPLLNNASSKLQKLVGDRSLFEARLLLAKVLSVELVDLIREDQIEIAESDEKIFSELVERRLKKEPMAYLLGEKEFFGMRFKVSHSVLIPRPETEDLVHESLDWIKSKRVDSNSARILDLGTGSGCIAISLSKNLPEYFEIEALDRSSEALEVARINAKKLGGANVKFIHEDFNQFEPSQKYSLIVSNPPYISTEEFEDLDEGIRAFEPRLALESGKCGLDDLLLIVARYPQYLLRPGLLALETGSFGQREAIKSRLESQSTVRIWDLNCHLFMEFG